MAPECRHIMPSGKKCGAAALKGGHFCYFHTRLHLIAKQETTVTDSIDIPVLEDRYAIQMAIAQVLRSLVNNSIDRPRASLLLYGLQLATQNVDHGKWAIPLRTVRAVTHTRDGDELAQDVDD
ncbi:MAG: hypothetical protein ACLQG3_00640 [Terracidiphilus sp.]